MGLFDEKTEGQKSRETVPLNLGITLYEQLYITLAK
jgi:hypothetical protein